MSGKIAIKIGRCILAEKPRRHRTDSKPSRPLMRLREVEKVIRARHGSMIPDPEDTDDRDTCIAYVKAAALSLTGQDMFAWCRKWAPWASPADILPIVAQASKRRHMINGNGCAGLLYVTWAERIRLGLKTIGACDMSESERKAAARDRKRERDRTAKATTRAAAGRQDRAAWLAQNRTSHDQPWIAAGMSRRTWYRRRGTSPSRVDIYTVGDTPVPNDGFPARPSFLNSSTGETRRREAAPSGLGENPPAGIQGAAPHGTCEILVAEKAA